MSSAIYVTFESPVSCEQWEDYCARTNLQYSPNTVGWTTFYADPQDVRFLGMRTGLITGRVEIRFGREGTAPAPLPDGQPDFATARPAAFARQIRISSYSGCYLWEIATIAADIVRTFGGTWEAAPELKAMMESAVAWMV